MEDDPHPFYPFYDTLTVVTLGAVVAIPRKFRRRHQFPGQLDWFGAMNSRLHVPHIRVPSAWHHLNTRMPLSMSVRDVLQPVPELAAPATPAARARARELTATADLAPGQRAARRVDNWGRRNWSPADIL
jgi:hypothetical protein